MSNRSLSTIVLSILLITTLLAACSPARDPSAPAPALNTDKQLSVSTSRRSAAFVPNAGQGDPAVLFTTLGPASTLFFTRHEVVFPLPSRNRVAEIFSRLLEPSESERAAPAEPTSLYLRFEGANLDTQVIGEEQLPGIVNYFIGDNPANWHANIPTYGSIVYERLYPGIDLLYDGGEGVLKGTYIVAPGASPGDIRWRYDGATSIDLDQGELLIEVAGTGEAAPLVERKPVAWQTVAGKRRSVSVRYVIHGDGSIGFALGKYDATQPLMIDPILDYSTYVGGINDEGSFGVAVDSDNNVYIAGSTESPSPGNTDIFVIKLDPSQTGANQLVYETYIGGSDEDVPGGIGVDSSGNVYVAGYTESNLDFPATANAFDQTFNGGSRDAVVVQLDATGAVNYASYLGGNGDDEARQVAVGDNTPMYVVGYTGSTNFPTKDEYQSDQTGPDAFVAVVDPSKSGVDSLVYSTYYGGSSSDEGWAIDVLDGIIYFAGCTSSDPLPLKNPVQPNYGGSGTWGFGDAFVAKLDPSLAGANQLLFATYLGGEDGENSGAIAVDASGDVYLVGATESDDFPTTGISPSYGGGDWDAFLVKLRTNSSSLIFSRFVGGSGNDGGRGVVLDAYGNAHVTGGTGSNDFPTVNPIQDTFRGGSGANYPLSWLGLGPGDAFVAKFDATGAMTFGTYLGGAGDEAGLGIALDTTGSIYVTGGTESTDFDTVNPFQDANAGEFDDFVAKISKQFTLTVNKAGSGTGTVTSDPAGIFCGADCIENYVVNTVVTLTATPDANSAFTGWSGDCSGTGLTTTVTMDADKTCTATFTSHTLTVNTAGSGDATGTVTSDPAGINCGGDCAEGYAPDTIVTLTAHPGVKSYFVGWSGDCSGTEHTAQVTMDADKTCTAAFGWPVGGVVVPVNKFELWPPWLGLAALVFLAALTVALVRRRKA